MGQKTASGLGNKTSPGKQDNTFEMKIKMKMKMYWAGFKPTRRSHGGWPSTSAPGS